MKALKKQHPVITELFWCSRFPSLGLYSLRIPPDSAHRYSDTIFCAVNAQHIQTEEHRQFTGMEASHRITRNEVIVYIPPCAARVVIQDLQLRSDVDVLRQGVAGSLLITARAFLHVQMNVLRNKR